MTTVPTKACSICREVKRLEAFGRDHRARDGRDSRCKACKSAADRYRYTLQADQQRLRYRDFYQSHRNEILQSKKAYRAGHTVERRDYYSRYYRQNKERVRAKTRQRRSEVVEWFRQVKATLSCVRCGENHPACLDFHHRNPWQKDDRVPYMVNQGLGKERILAEMAKCEVLCANCHRKVHSK